MKLKFLKVVKIAINISINENNKNALRMTIYII
jgi:hypothetical protein